MENTDIRAERDVELKRVKTGNMLCSCDDCVRNAVKLIGERI